jgi:hypothetical protein
MKGSGIAWKRSLPPIRALSSAMAFARIAPKSCTRIAPRRTGKGDWRSVGRDLGARKALRGRGGVSAKRRNGVSSAMLWARQAFSPAAFCHLLFVIGNWLSAIGYSLREAQRPATKKT